eukprot:11158676-Alexandrium_andersonii.AAC.1
MRWRLGRLILLAALAGIGRVTMGLPGERAKPTATTLACPAGHRAASIGNAHIVVHQHKASRKKHMHVCSRLHAWVCESARVRLCAWVP